MAAPHYVAGIDFNPEVRADAFSLMARLVEHYRNKSTDQAPQQWHEPVRDYLDPHLWQREMDSVHRKVPLPLAMSCELHGPGTYKAIEVVGTPVLVTRDSAGSVHAMLNVCRHRGGELVPEGTGKANRLSCPYHSWTYDLKGCLQGVYGENTFGDVDRNSMGLVALPAAERAGLVFVSLDPTATIDLDTWLGPKLITLLEAMALDRCYHYSTRTLNGPNWKVVVDGYLEGYHFASLHRTTVFRTNFSNMAAFDSWGPHQRNAFALRPIAHAAEMPQELWDPALCVGAIYWLFPGLAVAGGWRSQAVVSLVLPGTTWDTSYTQQILALRHEPKDDDERKAAEHTRDWFHDVVMDEDYATGYGVQRGLAAFDGQEFVFGRNEPGVQHFHRVLKEMVV
ncbi:MAG TPA: aromatic ring-hydroxylating dioxygenase subunit alpha [Pseudonocardiaceae bacterium]|jgi:nitrite reductase/ring-hydroxylating ferredoxin subunit